MDIEIFSFRWEDRVKFAMTSQIRHAVFVDEQGVPPELEHDDQEKAALHFLVMMGESPVAAARMRETGSGIKLERFAVLPEYRNRSLGAQLLAKALEAALPLKKNIYIHAQQAAVPFYTRHGFILSGAPFVEAGILHYKMEYPASQH